MPSFSTIMTFDFFDTFCHKKMCKTIFPECFFDQKNPAAISNTIHGMILCCSIQLFRIADQTYSISHASFVFVKENFERTKCVSQKTSSNYSKKIKSVIVAKMLSEKNCVHNNNLSRKKMSSNENRFLVHLQKCMQNRSQNQHTPD